MNAIFNAPGMRAMRLIGNSNPRYQWEQYWKSPEELAGMKKDVSVANSVVFWLSLENPPLTGATIQTKILRTAQRPRTTISLYRQAVGFFSSP
jgi:hypothetical protein